MRRVLGTALCFALVLAAAAAWALPAHKRAPAGGPSPNLRVSVARQLRLEVGLLPELGQTRRAQGGALGRAVRALPLAQVKRLGALLADPTHAIFAYGTAVHVTAGGTRATFEVNKGAVTVRALAELVVEEGGETGLGGGGLADLPAQPAQIRGRTRPATFRFTAPRDAGRGVQAVVVEGTETGPNADTGGLFDLR
ncbi:MAG: hypothetical protein IT371_27745 [Deltaproteobacteria bacterium]|nr:hypothetical protein [Deltaproteobacteria bacterium]